MGVFMSIDYGSKKTGLATTDLKKIIASALETVETKEIISYLHKFNQQNPIDKFIIGEPKQKDKILKIQNKALELSMFLSLPASIALLVGSEEIISSLFGYGRGCCRNV